MKTNLFALLFVLLGGHAAAADRQDNLALMIPGRNNFNLSSRFFSPMSSKLLTLIVKGQREARAMLYCYPYGELPDMTLYVEGPISDTEDEANIRFLKISKRIEILDASNPTSNKSLTLRSPEECEERLKELAGILQGQDNVMLLFNIKEIGTENMFMQVVLNRKSSKYPAN